MIKIKRTHIGCVFFCSNPEKPRFGSEELDMTTFYPHYLKNRWSGKLKSSEKLYWLKLLYVKMHTVREYADTHSIDFYIENGTCELVGVLPDEQYINVLDVVWDADLQDEDAYGSWYEAPSIMYTPSEVSQWADLFQDESIYDPSAIDVCIEKLKCHLKDNYDVELRKCDIDDIYTNECIARTAARDIWLPGAAPKTESARLLPMNFRF